MKKTLHELQLKFIIKNKTGGYVVAAFGSATDAIDYIEKAGDNYEIKESY